MLLKHNLSIAFKAIWGEMLKLACIIQGFKRTSILGDKVDGKDVIVSLTSYGRRINKTLPYTIYSLFHQSVMPSKIVLVLDNFERDTIGTRLELFKSKGLEIIFDDRDLRSYKKLIPTLEKYPDEIIITVDDDVFYRRHFIENMLKSYNEDKTCIHANMLHQITLDSEGNLNEYRNWIDTDFVKNLDITKGFPVGEGGIMYQRKLLHQDVNDVNLFKKLCPRADDIWFFVMAKLIGTKYREVKAQKNYFVPLDVFYQYTHKEASLAASNRDENMNDVQMNNVLNYYKTTMKELLFPRVNKH